MVMKDVINSGSLKQEESGGCQKSTRRNQETKKQFVNCDPKDGALLRFGNAN